MSMVKGRGGPKACLGRVLTYVTLNLAKQDTTTRPNLDVARGWRSTHTADTSHQATSGLPVTRSLEAGPLRPLALSSWHAPGPGLRCSSRVPPLAQAPSGSFPVAKRPPSDKAEALAELQRSHSLAAALLDRVPSRFHAHRHAVSLAASVLAERVRRCPQGHLKCSVCVASELAAIEF